MGKKKTEKERLISVNRAVKRVLILSCAYLMEDEKWGDKEICDFYDAICRWSDAIQDKMLSIQKVIDIINGKTGANLHW